MGFVEEFTPLAEDATYGLLAEVRKLGIAALNKVVDLSHGQRFFGRGENADDGKKDF